jgi:hypothetical protein
VISRGRRRRRLLTDELVGVRLRRIRWRTDHMKLVSNVRARELGEIETLNRYGTT